MQQVINLKTCKQMIIVQLDSDQLNSLIQNAFRKVISENAKPDKQPDSPELLTIDEASVFLRLAKPTIYSMVSRGRIPYMKRAKKLYFSKVELMNYLRQGKVNSVDQNNSEALQNIIIKKGRSHA